MKSRYLLEAAEQWGRELSALPAAPRGLYGFVSSVNLRKVPAGPGAWHFTNDPFLTWTQWEHDYEFTYDFTDSTVPSSGEFTIYNLSDATIARVGVGDLIECGGGYGGDVSWIFDGFITGMETRMKGADKATTFHFVNKYSGAATGPGGEERRVSLTYAAGVSAGMILRDLCERTGMVLAVFSLSADRVFPEAVTVEGDLNRKISEFAAMCGVWAYQVSCLLYVKDMRLNPPLTFVLNELHGLVGAPEPFEETVRDARAEDGAAAAVYRGYKVKMLLNHRVGTGIGIQLEARHAKGLFAVKSGRHVFNGLSATTEVKLIG